MPSIHRAPTRPFLLISTRPEDEAASAELNSFSEKMDLGADEIIQIRAESQAIGALNLDDWSGILLGGSPFNSSDTEKSETQQRVEAELARLMAQVLDADFPLFGACYGVGTVGTAIGAVIDTTYNETPRVITVSLTDAGAQDRLLEGMPERFSTMVGHKEAITVLPSTAQLLITGENCPVQMFRVGHNVYATQFHPELAPEAFAQRLRIYAGAGYYEPEEFGRIIAMTEGVNLNVDDQLLLNFARIYSRA